jgi:hypothetical protein
LFSERMLQPCQIEIGVQVGIHDDASDSDSLVPAGWSDYGR